MPKKTLGMTLQFPLTFHLTKMGMYLVIAQPMTIFMLTEMVFVII